MQPGTGLTIAEVVPPLFWSLYSPRKKNLFADYISQSRRKAGSPKIWFKEAEGVSFDDK